jgi:hypothetical protein
MSIRAEAEDWIVKAILHHGGKATLLEISKYVWDNYESYLRNHGDAFYTWQYDIRWAGQKLRDKKILKSATGSIKGTWEIL